MVVGGDLADDIRRRTNAILTLLDHVHAEPVNVTVPPPTQVHRATPLVDILDRANSSTPLHQREIPNLNIPLQANELGDENQEFEENQAENDIVEMEE